MRRRVPADQVSDPPTVRFSGDAAAHTPPVTKPWQYGRGFVAASFEIRPATARDVPAIKEMIDELAAYERLANEVVATEADLREALFGARPAAEAVIGYANGRPVGFALFFQSFSTFVGKPGLYLEDLFVMPEWRGKGLGRQLLRYLGQLAVERGYGRMEWSVLDWNEPALRVYRSIGARPMDEWTVHRLTGDALKRLANETCQPTEVRLKPDTTIPQTKRT